MQHTFFTRLAIIISIFAMACDEDSTASEGAADMSTTMSDTDVPQNGPIECPEGDNLPEGFVCIPAGEFWMGTPEDQIPRNALEEERHRVRITQPYLMGAYEVTQSEWNAVMETVPSYFSESGAGCTLEPCETRPVERVNWHEVIVYANQRSEAEGLTPCYATTGCSGELGIGCEEDREDCLAGYTCQTIERISACNGYRLPTEAEWEHAARAGDDAYRYGAIDDIAWYLGTARNRSRPVGGKLPNAWGLYDMYGNVSEWTFDTFNQDYGFFGTDSNEAIDDPVGGEFGDTRVVRGGNWSSGHEDCRAARREKAFPAYKNQKIGIRLVRQLRSNTQPSRRQRISLENRHQFDVINHSGLGWHIWG